MTSARSILLKLAALALFLVMPGPAVLVQQAAWVNMLVSYTQERGLKRGVIETFDGNHPCGLCKAAESIREQRDDTEEPAAPQEVRPNLAWGPMMVPAKTTAPRPTCRELPPPHTAWHRHGAGCGAESPDTPPPEAA
ncbi:MAG TPA: hypothetical protein VLO11_14810 [Luteolibacter sp.]|nr:hypothetical protein [Luteolibacter sp.]